MIQMRAVVLCETEEKTAGTTMILRAGGAQVVTEAELTAFYARSTGAFPYNP